MNLTTKQRQLVKEYIQTLQSKKLNEEVDDDYDRILTQYTNIVRNATETAKNKIMRACKKYGEDPNQWLEDFMEAINELNTEVEEIIFAVD